MGKMEAICTESTNATERNNPTERIIDAAQHLFQQTGFQKTTVADIARELRMSPANIYRFFSSRSEIDLAVCRRLLEEIEVTVAQEIAKSPGPAGRTLRKVIVSVSQMNARRYKFDRKLHELFETAHKENWLVVREHFSWLDKQVEFIINEGIESGEFCTGDTELASVLVRSVCLNFCNPRLMEEEPKPSIDQIVDFCIAALADREARVKHLPMGGGKDEHFANTNRGDLNWVSYSVRK
jgi:AcrR family transcriptional regulator